MELSSIERIPPPENGDTNRISSRVIHDLGRECGFDLVGVASADSVPDFDRFRGWVDRGLAGEMRYLTDHRADVRRDLNHLLPGVRSVICTGTLYNGPEPHSTEFTEPERAWISRYAWGDDYHNSIRAKLELFGSKLLIRNGCSWRSCVDTAPVLERSLARQAGLGWIGKNTCLINQARGSWFFLGEILTTLDIEPDHPAPDRCGTCSRCIDACPTAAIVQSPSGGWELDARLCISYLTIELKGPIPKEIRDGTGAHVFGCDICQDVCPWNSRADDSASFGRAELFAPPLERLAGITKPEFTQMFRGTPVTRAKYSGFLRNVAVAMGNSGQTEFRAPLERMAASDDPLVAEHADWALRKIACHKPQAPTVPAV